MVIMGDSLKDWRIRGLRERAERPPDSSAGIDPGSHLDSGVPELAGSLSLLKIEDEAVGSATTDGTGRKNRK